MHIQIKPTTVNIYQVRSCPYLTGRKITVQEYERHDLIQKHSFILREEEIEISRKKSLGSKFDYGELTERNSILVKGE